MVSTVTLTLITTLINIQTLMGGTQSRELPLAVPQLAQHVLWVLLLEV
jgi:hypothetical protein